MLNTDTVNHNYMFHCSDRTETACLPPYRETIIIINNVIADRRWRNKTESRVILATDKTLAVKENTLFSPAHGICSNLFIDKWYNSIKNMSRRIRDKYLPKSAANSSVLSQCVFSGKNFIKKLPLRFKEFEKKYFFGPMEFQFVVRKNVLSLKCSIIIRTSFVNQILLNSARSAPHCIAIIGRVSQFMQKHVHLQSGVNQKRNQKTDGYLLVQPKLEKAQSTPYNLSGFKKMNQFNYADFRMKYGLTQDIFGKVEAYPRGGYINGVFKEIYGNCLQTQRVLKTIKRGIEQNWIPKLSICWQLNEKFAESSVLGSYTAHVFYAIYNQKECISQGGVR